MFRVLYGELCGYLCDLAEYETYLQVTEALRVNDCKSLQRSPRCRLRSKQDV